MHDPLHAMLAHLVADTLGLDAAQALKLGPETRLLSPALGLSELDILEVAARVEEKFEVSFDGNAGTQDALSTIANLAAFIRRKTPVSILAGLPALDVEFDEDELMLPDGFRP